MLRRLRLEDFVILAEADIAFGPGLNVVTGETGTGKSILIDAIGFLAGGRADAGWVREGADALAVEGSFEIAGLPSAADAAARLGCPPEDGRIEMRRELSSGGRGKAFLQGRSVRLAELREVGGQLLAIHGQGEHRRLLDPSVQLELLDRFADAMSLRAAYAAARERWIEIGRELASARARSAELAEKEDWHRFQHDEIEAAALAPGEEERLRGLREAQARRRESREARAAIERILFEEEGSAADRIETALSRVSRFGEEWNPLREEVEAARDALRRARRRLPGGDAEAEDEDLDSIEERLKLLGRLKKKYGATEEAILEKRDHLRRLLEETERTRTRVGEMERERVAAGEEAAAAALRLRRARAAAAPRLGRAVTNELASLGMAGAILDVVLDEEEATGDDGLRVDGRVLASFPDGVDRGWFRLRPNRGEGAGPLGEVASGGELSRSLLALLAVLGGKEEPRTAIFDEVDAGVGGATAGAVARRLERLSRDRQVLLVTHLPLVACRASTHLQVVKRERAGRTLAGVSALDREERIGELARMLAGEVDSAIARKHARALIEAASAAEEQG